MGSQSVQDINQLWLTWVELWNGDFDVAAELVSPGFVAHFPPTGNTPVEVQGREGLTAGIQQFAAAFSEYTFTTTVGPIAQNGILAGRWSCRGLYNGVIPGSSPDMIGKEVVFEGADFLRIEGGQLVEYWLSADMLAFLQLVGVIPV